MKKNLNQDSERTRPKEASGTSTAEMNGAHGQDTFSRMDFVVQRFNIHLQKMKREMFPEYYRPNYRSFVAVFCFLEVAVRDHLNSVLQASISLMMAGSLVLI